MSVSLRVYKTSFPTQWIVSSNPGTPVPYYTKPEDGSSNTWVGPVPTVVEPHRASQGVSLEARQQQGTFPSTLGITKDSHPLNGRQDVPATPPPSHSQLLAASTNDSEIASYASSLKDSTLASSAKRNKLKKLLSFGRPIPAAPVDTASPKTLNSANSFWGPSPKRFGFRRQDKAWSNTETLQKSSSGSTASQENEHVLGSTQGTAYPRSMANQGTDAATNRSGPPTNYDPGFEPSPGVSTFQSPSGTPSSFAQSDAPARFPYTGSIYTPGAR